MTRESRYSDTYDTKRECPPNNDRVWNSFDDRIQHGTARASTITMMIIAVEYKLLLIRLNYEAPAESS